MKLSLFVITLFGLILVSINGQNICNCRTRSDLKEYTKSNTSYFIPWIALIKYNEKPICSGIIISDDTVLTSQNCINGKNRGHFRIVVGAKNITETRSDDNIFRVARFAKIEEFTPFALSSGNDIALLVVSGSFDLEVKRVEIACLDLKFNSTKYEMFTAGYGVPNENTHEFSDVLNYAFFKQKPDHNNYKIIAANATTERTLCTGMYGGPLMVKNQDGITKVVGIASYTDSGIDENGDLKYCTRDAYFTRLASFEKFILERVDLRRFCH